VAAPSLAEIFLAHVPPGGDPVGEDALVRTIAAARAARPGVPLDDAAFVRHLAERLPPGRALDGVDPGDLYLACACAARVPQALEAFERAYLANAEAYLARIDGGTALVEEVRQILRERLFVGAAPKIAEYSGRGALGAWVRVVAVRAALDLQRGKGARTASEEEAHALTRAPDPELDYIKLRYKDDFAAAVRDALAALDRKERTLLRLHYVEGMNLDRIAVVYAVHRATVHRWITGAREALFDGARKRIAERLRLDESEFESLAALVQSQIDVSLGGLLRDE
jgi:RNA polymerase sigma-70 factor (ECF subfamily)